MHTYLLIMTILFRSDGVASSVAETDSLENCKIAGERWKTHTEQLFSGYFNRSAYICVKK